MGFVFEVVATDSGDWMGFAFEGVATGSGWTSDGSSVGGVKASSST